MDAATLHPLRNCMFKEKIEMKLLKASAITFIFCFSALASSQDYIIDPTIRVGAITPTTTEKDLISLFGADNVKRYEIDVGEGDVVEGTMLFPGTDHALTIEWKTSFANPERITIRSGSTVWQTVQGIKIGSTLEEVEEANGNNFKITGFEWDYPGRTVSWEGGTLPKQLQLEFEPQTEVSFQEIMQVSGDSYFSSSNEIFKKMQLKVAVIYIRWDI